MAEGRPQAVVDVRICGIAGSGRLHHQDGGIDPGVGEQGGHGLGAQLTDVAVELFVSGAVGMSLDFDGARLVQQG